MSEPQQLLDPAAGRGSAFSINDALTIWRKRKWMILGIVTAIPLLVGFVVSKQPKVYEAQTSIVIDSSVPQYLGQNFKDVVEIESNWWSAQETLQTEFRVLKSYSQALATAHALCEIQVGPESKRESAMHRLMPDVNCAEKDDLARAAGFLQGVLRVDPVRESRIVTLTVAHHDPEMAALLPNTMAQVYTKRNLERRISQSESASSWLGDEYGDLTQQLNDSERALIEFKKKNSVVAVPIEDQQNDLSSRHKKLSDELNMVQLKLIGLRAQREQYAALKNADPMNEAVPGVSDTPVVQKLKELYIEQYAKLVELRGKYLDKHPTVMAQQARVDAIRADLVREATLSSKSTEAMYAALLKQEKDLRVALDGATHESLMLEQRAIEYNRLKRNFDRLSKLSDQVGGRERETSLAGHLKTNNVRILDLALVPSAAISPNVPAAIGTSILVALVLAFGLAFLLEMLDSTVKTQDDIEKWAGVTFLGVIPTIEAADGDAAPVVAPPALSEMIKRGSKDLYVLSHPRSSVAECCRAIRTNLLFMTPDAPAKTLLITSAGPQEGKTTTAVNMAITLAGSGLRVLLVDTDLRRPRLNKAFGIPATSEGVSKAIVGGPDTDVLSMVRETGVPNLSLLPCGATPPNPAELLHAERFAHIVEELTRHYDRVIFDSPPVGAVTDATILSRLTMGTVLVAKGGQTSKDALLRARRLLTTAGVNVLGCILNDLDMRKRGSYGYHYYSRYGYYSGDGNEKDPGAAPPPQTTNN
ncbi:MAG TPA: polysaccharide biosynthesis tyrosine autokinase [Polyangia bacterium]|nr:polysaccharide biosynthesis tyrosine autokinase [Polyangia bacterium]